MALLSSLFCGVHELLWKVFFCKSLVSSVSFCCMYYLIHLFFFRWFNENALQVKLFLYIKLIWIVNQAKHSQQVSFFLTSGMFELAFFSIVTLIFAPKSLRKLDHSLIQNKFCWGGIPNILKSNDINKLSKWFRFSSGNCLFILLDLMQKNPDFCLCFLGYFLFITKFQGK